MCGGWTEEAETFCTFCHQAFKDGVIMEKGEYRCYLTSKDGQKRPYKK